jgi:cyclophilin family peptidyl-prolyl cis-trans isomerase
MKKIHWLFIFLIAILATTVPACSQSNTPTLSNTPSANQGGNNMQWSTPPAMTIDKNKQYTANITTNYGTIIVQLLAKEDPITVNNFVFLARQGYYNGVKFHRVVKNFMIQTGDPTGTGGGNPGYRIQDEKVTRNYVAGTLAMANTGQPNTGSAQFFITLVDATQMLTKTYTIFGIVTSGFDIVTKIGNVPVKANMVGELSTPTVDVHIDTVTITEQ